MQNSVSDKKDIVSKIQAEPPPSVAQEVKENKFTRKEKIDLFFRVVAMLAIGMPVVMFLFQQNATVKQQRAMSQLETYTNTTRELNSLLRRPAGSVEFNQSKDKLEYDLLPKIDYLFGSDITNELDNMNRSILVYTDVSKTVGLFDELQELENNFGSGLCSFQNETSISPDDQKDQQNNYKLLDSLVAEYIEQDKKMQQWNAQSLDGDSELQKLVPALAEIVKKQNTFHIAFQSDCDEIITSFNLPGANKKLTSVYQALREKKEELQKNSKQMKLSVHTLSDKVKDHMNSEISGMKAKMKANNKLLQ